MQPLAASTLFPPVQSLGSNSAEGGGAEGEDQGKGTRPTHLDSSIEINIKTLSEFAREITITYFFLLKLGFILQTQSIP